MNAVGMTNRQQQQVGLGKNGNTENQEQPNPGDEEKSKEQAVINTVSTMRIILFPDSR